MESKPQLLHEVAITAIVVKDGKYLITRRVMTKKRFPGKWTVPEEVGDERLYQFTQRYRGLLV